MALAVVAAVTLLRRELIPWLGVTAPYNLAVVAIVATTVLLGFGPGLLTALLACAGVELFVMGSLPSALDGQAAARMAFALLVGPAIAWILHVVRAAELKSRRNDRRLAAFAAATFEGIVESEAGQIVDCNEQFGRMVGRAAGDLRGIAITELVAPEDLERVTEDLGPNRESVIEHALLRADGSRILVETRSWPADPGGRRRYTAVRDITAQRRSEEALLRHRADLELALDAAEMGAWYWDIITGEVVWSPRCKALYGLPADAEISYSRFLQAVHPDDRVRVDAALKEAVAQGSEYRLEKRILWPDGTERWTAARGRCVHDNAGRPVRMTGVSLDITGLKRAEEDARQSRQDLDRAQEVGHIGWWRLDTRHNVLTWSDENHRIFGVAKGTPLDYEAFLEIVHPDDRQYVNTQWQAGLRGEPYDLEHRIVVDGRVKWVREKAYLEFGEAGQLLGGVGITQDISERKQAEAELRSIASFPEENPNPVLRADAEGRILYANRPARALLATMTAGDSLVLPQALADGVSRILAGAGGHEVEISGPSGSFFLFSLARSSVEGWVNLYGRNLTERRRMEDSLREADRRKDEFLATLAHELRNPLAPLRSGLQVLRRVGGTGPDAERMQAVMERQVDHLVRLVDDILEASRISRGKIELRREPVELADVIRQAVETSQPLIEASGHELTVELAPEPLLVDGDPVRLAQVFANLANNAAKYTEPGGRIRIRAECKGGEASVSVSDSGIGIPAEMLPRVFDLFAQFDRDSGRSQGGLGIGLALVRSLVEMHGGRVEVRSEGPGRGSEFTVHLPVIAAAPALPAQSHATPARLSLRILVVDDNRDAADSLGMLLEALGAEVRVAYDGPAGLAALEHFAPQAVLLDLGMPGMDGYETARRLRLSPPARDMILIALTGWGQNEEQRRTRQAGFDHHLVKPVDIAELLGVLATASRADATAGA
jgi:PAS domain S-box-containing protein